MTEEWLLDRVVVCPSGCWIWLGSDSGSAGRGGGYAKMMEEGRTVYVHRRVHEEFVGPIPPGWQVDHKCTAGGWLPRVHRRCVRPEHLEAVPNLENQRRKVRR